MEKKVEEARINNSFEILLKFHKSNKAYKRPIPKSKGVYMEHTERNGKPKIFTPDEIFLYKVRKSAHLISTQ